MSTNDTSAPLDIDAIEARHREAAERTGAMPPVWRSASDVPELVAEVRRLRGQLAACVDALGVVVPLDATAADAIVDEHQRATGETRALRLARDAAEEEVRRLRSMLAAETASHRRDLRDDARALDDLIAEVWRALGETHEPPADVVTLLARATGLRESHRERGEALLTMTRRALDAERLLDSTESTEREEELARQIRATARREGAEAMREALVSALDAMVHAEATEAELFRMTRNEDGAAEHHHKRAVLLETRVTALSLQLPEVTP